MDKIIELDKLINNPEMILMLMFLVHCLQILTSIRLEILIGRCIRLYCLVSQQWIIKNWGKCHNAEMENALIKMKSLIPIESRTEMKKARLV